VIRTTWIILMLVGINVSISAMFLRLRQIDKAIERLPYIIKSQAEGRERYVELLERKLREHGLA
tara:strand:- start:119 stop:310 length:192 start_codon:yes stop_codon:yes gene_type:complete